VLAPYLAYKSKRSITFQYSPGVSDIDLNESGPGSEHHTQSQRENSYRTEQYLKIEKKNTFEVIDEYEDKYPLLEFRKAFGRVRFGISYTCKVFISSPIFEFFIILVIIANTITLALEDPTVE